MHLRPNETKLNHPLVEASFAAECNLELMRTPLIGTAAALGCSAWLSKFNFSKHDDGFFVADLSLIYRPSVPFIN